MRTFHEQGLGAEAIMSAYLDEQLKLSTATVSMKGDQLS